jgi:hypothetical protein
VRERDLGTWSRGKRKVLRARAHTHTHRFGDLEEKETKKYFDKFVEKYNAGELPEKMYKGIAFRSHLCTGNYYFLIIGDYYF